ncbi:MAG: sulfurtransferase complex subunit TusC [Pseudomonadales bacterium]|nr:sulfurtransferase complex subunit TusC [Pseudomonadales bacterium]
MSAANKTITFISRRAPYSTEHAKACLDMVLAAAVFDQQVHYLFMDDGVYQLLAGQRPENIHNKNLGAALEALPLYGVDSILVEAQSLQERNLTADQLLQTGFRTCSRDELRNLIKASDQVFTL